MRESLELELTKENRELLDSLQEALDHDEPEQTFQVMLHLLSLAVSLTSKDSPTIRLYTRDPQRPTLNQVICPHCQREVPVHHSESDGFREGSMKLC